ncbi:IclR family transcriptional regulator [Geosporobacter ferrireducens]|uniref:Glycerol operon regulatory protein n=1 Tax=Geosporobacter ferrireducens TaxID=1424294 RepID=A0A1D8GHW7_9FIRM|nr:IclR family transcriptional regulator [Geosporobacter ferrireducens]AOT70496.1 hypothetical protein Gferi_13475 [Geosporobacter ferrireducens]MTI57152.1 IclR family transcriptional regulator [Geosporobacter ferrireducens]
MAEKNSENSVRSIQRALHILLCFNWKEKELTMTEITEKMGLAKSTTSRLLATLEAEGFIKRDPKNNKYSLGHNMYYLGLIAKEKLELNEIARPVMEEINKTTKETINLYILDNLESMCLAQVESPLPIRQAIKIGERSPLWAGASGRAILSGLEEKLWFDMIKELKSFTPNTITDPDVFINTMKGVKQNGYAISLGEKDDQVGCVAAPIFDAHGKVIGCVAISGPVFRFPDNTDLFCSLIVNGAKRISHQLGYNENKLAII